MNMLIAGQVLRAELSENPIQKSGPLSGTRTCLTEEFLHQYQRDMLSLVEQIRELRRSRKEGPSQRPVPNYGSPRGLARLAGAALKPAGTQAPMSRLRVLQIRLAMLRAIVVPLGWLFWRLEQSRARLQTTLDNETASDAHH
jgi:hypothetical protein